MAVPLMIPWSANALVGATATVVGASEDADFPVDNLVDADQMTASKLSATTGMWVFDFGSAVHLAVFAVLHHNFDAAITVEVRGYSSAPSALADVPALAVPLTIPARTGYYRPNVWADIDAVSAVASYRYWALAVSSANTAALTVGEMFASVARHALPIQFELAGYEPGVQTDTIENSTYGGGSLRSQKGFPIVLFAGKQTGTLATVSTLEQVFQDVVGQAAPVLFVPDSGSSDVYLMLIDQNTLSRPVRMGRFYSISIALRELSRGLRWP